MQIKLEKWLKTGRKINNSLFKELAANEGLRSENEQKKENVFVSTSH